MTKETRYWRATLAFGLLTLGTFLWFAAKPVPDCGAPMPTAMLDFEMATTQPQFAAVLDCAPRLAALDAHNVVDLLLFMWAYTGLLVFFALGTGIRRAVALGLGVLIVGSDFVETIILRQIAAAWPALDMGMVPALAVSTRLKFVAIGLLMTLTAARLWRGSAGAKVVAALALIGGAASVGILWPETRALGSPAIGLAWVAMLIYAGVSAPRSQPPAPSSAAV